MRTSPARCAAALSRRRLHVSPGATVLAALGLWATSACGGDDSAPDPTAQRRADTTPRASPDPQRTLGDAIAATREGDVPALLVVLGQPHARALAALGPHTMSWTAVFELEGTTPRAPLPPLDSAVVDDQRIEDSGILVWESTAPQPPAWSLSQSNDHERGREVIGLGTQMFVRMRHRAWVAQPYDDAAVALWLDDAQQIVHDAVEFAAPRLALEIETGEGRGIDAGDAWVLTLSRAADAVELPTDRASAQGVRRAWRDDATLSAISGTVTIDAGTGIWLAADLQVHYSLRAADARTMRGSLSLRAEVKSGSPDPVLAPTDAVPLPERTRYVRERNTLLEGL